MANPKHCLIVLKYRTPNMCIFTVKNVIKYHTRTIVLFLHAHLMQLEAFDTVSHWTVDIFLVKYF